MTGMGEVLRRDFRDLRRTNAFRIIAIIFALVTIAAAVGTSIAFNRAEITKLGAEQIMGLVVYFLTFFALISFIWAFAAEPITKEKANGNIESLLATPLSSRAVWMGKSLAISLPGFVIAIVSSLIVVLAVNFAVIHPTTGDFVLPASVLLTGFVVNPLLLFGLTSLIILICLVYSSGIGIVLSYLLGIGLMYGIIVGLVMGAINLASWNFALAYLAGAIVLGAVVFYLSRLLTKEKVVLSSKGG